MSSFKCSVKRIRIATQLYLKTWTEEESTNSTYSFKQRHTEETSKQQSHLQKDIGDGDKDVDGTLKEELIALARESKAKAPAFRDFVTFRAVVFRDALRNFIIGYREGLEEEKILTLEEQNQSSKSTQNSSSNNK